MAVAARVSDGVRTLYARYEHGGYPVLVQQTDQQRLKFEVQWPDGPAAYPSGRQLLRALYGDRRPPNLTVDQYFRLAVRAAPEPSVFDLFAQPLPDNVVPLREYRERRDRERRVRARPIEDDSFSTLVMFARPPEPAVPVAVEAPAIGKATPLAVLEPTLGIDLEARGHEVRKILFKGFSSLINRKGLDPDDVLQEVYRGLMARNAGRCPFDPRKSSFGHYVHMVCSCILLNLVRKKKRQDEKEQLGIQTRGRLGDEKYGYTVDAALAARSDQGERASVETDEAARTRQAVSALLAIVGPQEARLAERVLPMLLAGQTKKDIVKVLGRDKTSRAFAVLQAAGRELQLA